MKGLEEYIKKHGNHFTEELAYSACGKKWSIEKVKNAAQRRVYYNVTESTSGDMLYLVDIFSSRYTSFSRCIKEMLSWIEDYYKTGSAFCLWLTLLVVNKTDFDFTPYI